MSEVQAATKWAPTEKVVLGCVAFVVWWVLAVFPSVKCLPIGRTAGSLLGAVLMVVFQVISPNEAFASVDLPILALLFGTMLISVYLERAGLFRYLGLVLSWKSKGPRDLLCRVCALSALCSALFTNDTTCVVLTDFVLRLCNDKKLPPLPFLLGLATSANIGSAGTSIGNPQNLVIAVQSHITFIKFLSGIIPAVVVGVVVNTFLLLICYWKPLSTHSNPNATQDEQRGHDIEDGRCRDAVELPTVNVNSSSPTVSSGRRNQDADLPANRAGETGETASASEINVLRSSDPDIPSASPPPRRTNSISSKAKASTIALPVQDSQLEDDEPEPSESTAATAAAAAERSKRRSKISNVSNVKALRQRCWVPFVYLTTVGFLVALLAGLNLSWSAVTAALALIVYDFQDADASLNKVKYSLLVFFAGMFIAVQGFNLTGAPGEFWTAVEPQSHIDNAKGLTILSLVIVLLSNVASNVPTVLLLGSRVAASAAMTGASVTKAWLILAWVSTVAGNLTLLGSAANLIVSEQARTSQLSEKFSFKRHLPFGFPSTLIVIAVGVPLIRG